ncbi:MAG: hypothetical protein ACFFDH_00285 [Promethearchaeota archaeon]
MKGKVNTILKNGKVVAKAYGIPKIEDNEIIFDKIVIEGDVKGKLEYKNREIKIVEVSDIKGMEDRIGPVWKEVKCEILKYRMKSKAYAFNYVILINPKFLRTFKEFARYKNYEEIYDILIQIGEKQKTFTLKEFKERLGF